MYVCMYVMHICMYIRLYCMYVCSMHTCMHVRMRFLKFGLPGNLPGIFRKPSGSTFFLLLRCWDICWHAGVACFLRFPTPVDLGVAVGGCSSGNLPEIFRKSSGISGDVQGQARLQEICSGALCVFALPGNLPGTFRKPSGTMRFLTPPVAHKRAHF